MKAILHSLTLAIVAAFLFVCAACAGRTTPIQVNQLPTQARQMLKTHFNSSRVALVTKEREGLGWSYEVTFSNGDQVEFDKSGQWTDLDCKRSQVPLRLVPPAVRRYVAANYRGARVIKLSRDRKGFEAELSNRIELEFDRQGRLTGIDS